METGNKLADDMRPHRYHGIIMDRNKPNCAVHIFISPEIFTGYGGFFVVFCCDIAPINYTRIIQGYFTDTVQFHNCPSTSQTTPKHMKNELHKTSGGRLNKKDGLTRYGDSYVKDKTS